MKLFLTAKSERGKPITKSGNEYLKVDIIDEGRQPIITLHLTVAKSQVRGQYYNLYLTNHKPKLIELN